VNAPDQRRRAFAEYVAQGKTGTEAARLAGYKGTDASLGNQACRLIKNDEVQAMIKEAVAKASKGRIVTAQRRRELLSDIAEGITKTTAEGAAGPTTRDPTPAERVQAIKHLDELDGLVRQKVEHSGPNGQPIGAVLATIPEDEIRKRLAELAKRKTK
jgi:phage terminase small subunit